MDGKQEEVIPVVDVKAETKKVSAFSSKQNKDDVKITRRLNVWTPSDITRFQGTVIFLFQTTESNGVPTASHVVKKDVDYHLPSMSAEAKTYLEEMRAKNPMVIWSKVEEARDKYKMLIMMGFEEVKENVK
jgi:hypothetical protein